MADLSIDHRHLRSALEFALTMAQEGQKLRPPLKYPAGLKKYMSAQRVPAASLPSIRRLVESDELFRTRIAAGALPELVDPIGKLWLERPEGWETAVANLVARTEADEEAADVTKALRKAEKRREAAEVATVRARAEIVVLNEQVAERSSVIDVLRADVEKLRESVDELRAELVDSRNELRHARDREASAIARLTESESNRDAADAARGSAESVRDDVLAAQAVVATEHSELARLAATAESLASQLASLSSPPVDGASRPVATRKALPLLGGVLGTSETAAEYLLRAGASVLVDGYNVAKLAWPKLDLAGQRVVLLDATENLVRRSGSDITVVFDGADVVGASADGRRIVRVVYSPEGIIADDVIRDEVRRLPATRQVVVVTNDQEIVGDVRAMGANTMSSNQFHALMR
jgi:predicted RNA-binding protein with PIN domain/cell division protein FtsB